MNTPLLRLSEINDEENLGSGLCSVCRAHPLLDDESAQSGLCEDCHNTSVFDSAKTCGSLLELSDLENLQSPEPFVKGRFNSRSVCLIFGSPTTFKSFFVLDYILTLAWEEAKNWHGLKIMKHARTLYVTNEGTGGLKKRVKAWEKYNKTIAPEGVKVYVPKGPLWDHRNGQPVLTEIVAVARAMKADLIVFDTLASLFGGISENDSNDVSVITNCLSVIRNEYGIGSIIIHHSTKANGKNYRGSSAMLGNTDEVYAVTRTDKTCKIESVKVKDSEDWKLDFAVTEVKVGCDDDGDDITSLAIVTCVQSEKEPLASRILDYLLKHTDSAFTTEEIRVGMEMYDTSKTMYAAMRKLVTEEQVVETGVKGGPKGNAKMFQAAESADE
jgi:hypothetical protein